jgi:hypothetical protein
MRLYQLCRSGLVAASATHGRPTVATSSSRMRGVGLAPAISAVGFQVTDGTIAGSAAAAAPASNTACTIACDRVPSRPTPRWA